MIDKIDVNVLRDFEEIAKTKGISCMLIGAGARLLLIDWPRKIANPRITRDWDFGVKVGDWQVYKDLKQSLLASGNFSSLSGEHRVKHKSGIALDFVPFGGIESPAGEILWEKDNHPMNVLGFSEALENATETIIDDQCSIPVVSIPCFVVLKIFSYNDRRGEEKQKDFEDICYVFLNYINSENEVHMFNELEQYWEKGNVTYDTAGACLLGKEVAGIIKLDTYVTLIPIIEKLCDVNNTSIRNYSKNPNKSESEEDKVCEKIIDLFSTFKNSLSEHFGKGKGID